jgi:shikimate dehydrogenase
VIANRTLTKAEELVALFSDIGRLEACAFAELQGQEFDLVINGTAASLQGSLPPLPDALLGDEACCYDMMYARQATPFQQWGREQGARLSLDGLGMLVEQAAESFFIWRQVRPQTAGVITAIRQALNSTP